MKTSTEKVLIALLFCCLMLFSCQTKQSETSGEAIHTPSISSSKNTDSPSSLYDTAALPTPSPLPTLEPTPELTEEPTAEPTNEPTPEPEPTYIANENTGKFHYPDCFSVDRMKEYNKWEFYGTREELIDMGYKPCKKCCP